MLGASGLCTVCGRVSLPFSALVLIEYADRNELRWVCPRCGLYREHDISEHVADSLREWGVRPLIAHQNARELENLRAWMDSPDWSVLMPPAADEP